MKGGIYPNKGPGAPWQVRYGKIHKRFWSEKKAEIFWAGLILKDHEGVLDERDYRRDNPLGFANQTGKWLDIRKGQVRCFRNLENHIGRAADFFGNKNIKSITYANLEDFLFALPETLSGKSKANILATLHAFFVWLKRRGEIQSVPEFPTVKYELGYRKLIDLDTQARIIDEVKHISSFNSRIWFGVYLLSRYTELRPGDLLNLKEKHMVLGQGILTIPHPKDACYKVVPLMDEDVALFKGFPTGFPELHFFRHLGGVKGTRPGQPFGSKYLWVWWKRACANLGIEGVDLYGGTRHSTTSALGDLLTPEEIILLHGDRTNKAFKRYFQRSRKDIRELRERAFGAREEKRKVDLTRTILP